MSPVPLNPPKGFTTPNWDAPLDPKPFLTGLPAQSLVKGMVFQGILDIGKAIGRTLPDFGPYRAFKDYPLEELLLLEMAACKAFFPDLPLRQGLRRIGWTIYPTVAESMIGRVVFGVLGRDVASLFKVAPKGYSITATHGRMDIVEVGTQHAHVRLCDAYNFGDSVQIGVIEGGFRHLKVEGDLYVSVVDRTTIDLFATWA